MSDEGLKAYHDQTVWVEGLIGFHPDFHPNLDPSFTKEERQIFSDVFLPNWANYGNDYRNVYDHFCRNEPEKFQRAQGLLKQWAEIHGIDTGESDFLSQC